MYDCVDKIIFKSIQLHSKIPYKAFSLAASLKKDKTLVSEVFGWFKCHIIALYFIRMLKHYY